jgi:hypothetical protein
MMEWFASKAGFVIFIVAALFTFLAFSLVQADILGKAMDACYAGDIARAAGTMPENSSVRIGFQSAINIKSNGTDITVGGSSRALFSRISPVQLISKAVMLKKTGDVVYIENA